jgi:hypothetical protein
VRKDEFAAAVTDAMKYRVFVTDRRVGELHTAVAEEDLPGAVDAAERLRAALGVGS